MALPASRSLVLAILTTAAALAPNASAGPTPGALRRVVTELGRSIGSPTEGHLVGGAHLLEGPHLRIVPSYAAGDARWGVEPLVSMIDRAGRAVRKQFPDAMLSVGHLSRAGGGEIDRHASHESGRDADIGFYVRNEQNKPIYADHFVPFKGDGTATTWPGARFDDARNWALVAAIVTDTRARVTHIFVAAPLRARLLSFAEKIGAPPAIRSRAAELMAQPRGALPHDDHFHVRIACPSGMEKCIEQPLARKRRPHEASKPALAHDHPSKVSPPPGHAPPKPKPEPSERSEKSESLVPSLAPIIPGLDSAIIPAPLVGVRPDPAPLRPPPIIDDPDGVLENVP